MRLTMLVVVMICTRVAFPQRQTLRRKLLQSTAATDKETGLEDGFSCVLEFLQNHLQSPEYLSLFLLHPPSNQPSDTSEVILNQLLQAFPSFLLQGELDADGTQDNNVNAIIILDDFASLQQATVNFLDLCSIKCTYAVILAQPVYNDEKEFRNSTNQWTQMFLHHKVVNIALIYRIRQKFHMAKSVSFEPNVPCHPSPLTSFGECKPGWKNWQPFDRPARLNNCTVREHRDPLIFHSRLSGFIIRPFNIRITSFAKHFTLRSILLNYNPIIFIFRCALFIKGIYKLGRDIFNFRIHDCTSFRANFVIWICCDFFHRVKIISVTC